MSPPNLTIDRLPDSIDYACLLALRNKRDGTLGTEPAFMLCIDGDCDVTVCYCNDTDDWAPPAGTSFVWDVLIRSGELLSILDTVAGLGLDLHKSKERMTNCILAQLNGLIYKMHNPNGHVMLLAAVIDRLTMQGIRDFAERMANKRLQPIYRPELN